MLSKIEKEIFTEVPENMAALLERKIYFGFFPDYNMGISAITNQDGENTY